MHCQFIGALSAFVELAIVGSDTRGDKPEAFHVQEEKLVLVLRRVFVLLPKLSANFFVAFGDLGVFKILASSVLDVAMHVYKIPRMDGTFHSMAE
jgi:hypothetical protein